LDKIKIARRPVSFMKTVLPVSQRSNNSRSAATLVRVNRQDQTYLTMWEWAQHFETPHAQRERRLNVISLPVRPEMVALRQTLSGIYRVCFS